MRPATPRLRVNSEDVDLACGPPYLSPSQQQLSLTQGSNQHWQQQTITLYPAELTARKPKPVPTSFPIANDSVIAALVANSDPNDISVL